MSTAVLDPALAEVVSDNPADQFEPFADFVLVEPIRPGQTASGLALPDNADTGPMKAKVLAAGPGRYTEFGSWLETPVKAGDVVYLVILGAGAAEMTFGSRKCLLARARDLCGKVRC